MSGQAARAPPSAAATRPDIIDLLDSDSEDSPLRTTSGRGAGPSGRQATTSGQRRQQQQQRRRSAPGMAAAVGAHADVIDLTGPAAEADLQIVRSTVQRLPTRGVKRSRPTAAQQLSPMKQLLLQQLRNPPPPPPAEPEPEGPKCGICMEPMGGSQGRQMASGNCGHVYCYDCLVAAVRTQKKCPTCRKGMQQRQIHKVFINT
ncbi:hypothetical protein CHLNCDRAFT_142715 [Chlorella variabilis]|uniref:RING-type domain-containing protein n=1 Tax=Chlorella variabilis TaxID=554065 RepID=E1Z8J9_CHLVA|nr:hypothetical protein CHLNCDRAFT_142715 [Chlorella variabilis]EFN57621.1 hypothetical protein CHLNCDRAFT_142715 [Chlorella variabilis]|eukprot:XP_005849723.1 hypothetical protein CHLNCDRAFT_142715 [Chlorella variabilis]